MVCSSTLSVCPVSAFAGAGQAAMLRSFSRAVDRTKKRGGSRTPPSPGNRLLGPPPREGRSPQVPNQDVQQLRSLLAASGRRFEAVTVVMQQILAEVGGAQSTNPRLSRLFLSLPIHLSAMYIACIILSHLLLQNDKIRNDKITVYVAFAVFN